MSAEGRNMATNIRANPLLRECLAEFIGTFILMVFGTGVGAQVLLSHGKMGAPVTGSMTWGIGVMMGVYVSGGVTGGHINPAVSVAMAMLGRLSWFKVPFYYVSQCLGSFTASCLVYLVYWEALDAYDGGERQVSGLNATAGIWTTFPQPYVSVWTSLGDQIFSTGVLLICVLALTDPRNMNPAKGIFPVVVGLLVIGLSMSYSLNCGNAMNPARDLIPRLFTTLAGWHITPLSYRNYNYFWVNIVGPHVGAVVGAYIYQLFVGYHWPESDPSVDCSSDERLPSPSENEKIKSTKKQNGATVPTCCCDCRSKTDDLKDEQGKRKSDSDGEVNKGFESSESSENTLRRKPQQLINNGGQE